MGKSALLIVGEHLQSCAGLLELQSAASRGSGACLRTCLTVAPLSWNCAQRRRTCSGAHCLLAPSFLRVWARHGRERLVIVGERSQSCAGLLELQSAASRGSGACLRTCLTVAPLSWNCAQRRRTCLGAHFLLAPLFLLVGHVMGKSALLIVGQRCETGLDCWSCSCQSLLVVEFLSMHSPIVESYSMCGCLQSDGAILA